MKSTSFKLLTFIGLTAIGFACSEEEPVVVTPEPAPKTSVQFSQNTRSMLENGLSQEITITLDKPASKAGSVFLQVSGSVDHLSFNPVLNDQGQVALAIAEQQTSLKITITPVDNTLLDGDKSVVMTIASVSDGFTIAAVNTMMATVVDNESPARINFLLNTGSSRENASQAAEVMLVLSHKAPGAGSIEISLSTVKAIYGTHFTTEPEALNGKLIVPVAEGMDHTSFTIVPINDQFFNGDRKITYTLSGAQGAIRLGTEITHQFLITDDELAGMRKSFETVAGNGWSNKNQYEYDEQGRLAKVVWQQNTLTGSNTYQYDPTGKLVSMTSSDHSVTEYLYDTEGRIIRDEKRKEGVLNQYNIYSYDAAGNVGEAAVHYRQPNGELVLSTVFVYLYYTDGNLYKRMVYIPQNESQELEQVSEETFSGYLEKENQFPVYEIVPGLPTQVTLPSSYQYNTGGSELTYTFGYEYDDAGRMSRRYVYRNGVAIETNRYEYY